MYPSVYVRVKILAYPELCSILQTNRIIHTSNLATDDSKSGGCRYPTLVVVCEDILTHLRHAARLLEASSLAQWYAGSTLSMSEQKSFQEENSIQIQSMVGCHTTNATLVRNAATQIIFAKHLEASASESSPSAPASEAASSSIISTSGIPLKDSLRLLVELLLSLFLLPCLLFNILLSPRLRPPRV